MTREIPLKEISLASDDKATPLFAKEELRAYMLTNSIKGNVIMPRRTPFIGGTKPFQSPIDPTTTFVIRRLSNRQVILYRDRNSVIRYVTESGNNGERYITERDYPTGTMTLDVAVLGLASWNIRDPEDRDLKITEETLTDYLDPEELDYVADKVFEVNPILRGNQKREPEKDTESPDGGGVRGDEPSPIQQLLSDAGTGTGDLREGIVSPPLSSDMARVPKTF